MSDQPYVPPSAEVIAQRSKPSPHPLQSLLASAQRLTRKTISKRGNNAKPWQEDAWEMYDLVGEERFLAATLAGRLSQARLYVGKIGESTDAPDPVEDASITDLLDAFGVSSASRAQLILRMGINLFVAGDGWFAGIPKRLLPESMRPELPEFDLLEPLVVEDLEWRMLSVSEVSVTSQGMVTLALGESSSEKIICEPDDIFLIRVWRPHPRRWWEADSPTRSSLPVLRELVGLTMHISAQVDSRLAGAGLLIVPQSAQRALQVAAGLTEDDATDQFTEALIEAMLIPVNDRASASALVPLVVTVPDEACDKFNYMNFSRPLDTEARSLRDEAIRRLALGQDAPPELLLGTAGMNHWGAWLVQQDVVTTHLEPPLALICDALTTQYLWPVLIDQGMPEILAHEYVIWYDVTDMVVRPNHSQDAMELQHRGVITNTALRNATGFDASDAPDVDKLPLEVQMALEMIKTSPALVANPGLPELVAQIRAVLTGQIPAVMEPSKALVPEVGGESNEPTGAAPPNVPTTDASPAVVPPLPPAAATNMEIFSDGHVIGVTHSVS